MTLEYVLKPNAKFTTFTTYVTRHAQKDIWQPKILLRCKQLTKMHIEIKYWKFTFHSYIINLKKYNTFNLEKIVPDWYFWNAFWPWVHSYKTLIEDVDIFLSQKSIFLCHCWHFHLWNLMISGLMHKGLQNKKKQKNESLSNVLLVRKE